MKKAVAYSIVPVLLALPFAQASSAARRETRVHHTVVAASGSPAPAGGNYFGFSAVDVNARSQVTFNASLLGPSTTGVFVVDGRTTSAIALGGNPDPAAGNFGFVSNPFITPQGRVVFDADVAGIFRSNGRMTIPLVRDGDPAPGGGTLSASEHRANDRGAIAFAASVLDATSTLGIFRADGADTVAIARNGSAAPTGGTFTFFSKPALNDRGQVAFFGEMSGGTGDFGIFRGDGGDLTPVFVANQAAPGGGTFVDFSDPLINKHGQVVASVLLTNGAGANGLVVGDGTDTVAIALEGHAAPKGGNYAGTFALPLTLNDRGEVAFNVRLTGGTSGGGIFRGDGGHTTVVALNGTLAPGTNGTFQTFRDLRLGRDGQVAFIATLAIGTGGVDLSNNQGIWVGRSDEDLRLVVRTGDEINGRVLTALPAFGQFDMDDDGGVVWVGRFSSGSAVVFSRICDEDEDNHGRGGDHQRR